MHLSLGLEIDWDHSLASSRIIYNCLRTQHEAEEFQISHLPVSSPFLCSFLQRRRSQVKIEVKVLQRSKPAIHPPGYTGLKFFTSYMRGDHKYVLQGRIMNTYYYSLLFTFSVHTRLPSVGVFTLIMTRSDS
jgi:hypothetical protein